MQSAQRVQRSLQVLPIVPAAERGASANAPAARATPRALTPPLPFAGGETHGHVDGEGTRPSAIALVLGLLAPSARRPQPWVWRTIGDHLRKNARRASPPALSIAPDLVRHERARRSVGEAARRAGVFAGACALGSRALQMVAVASEGLAIPATVALGVASKVAETRYVSQLAFDLVVDVAAIYGAPFALHDEGEVAAILDVVFPWRTDARVAPLVRHHAHAIGRKLVVDAVLRAVPLLSMPCSGGLTYREMLAIGERAIACSQKRRALGLAAATWVKRAPESFDLVFGFLAPSAIADHEALLVLAMIAAQTVSIDVVRAAAEPWGRFDAMSFGDRRHVVDSLAAIHALLGSDARRSHLLSRFRQEALAPAAAPSSEPFASAPRQQPAA